MEYTYTTRGQVTDHPLGVAIAVLLVGEHRLVGVTEGEVQGLGREVTDDVGSVTSPQGDNTLGGSGTLEAVDDSIVLAVETTSLNHLILHRDQYQSLFRVRRHPACRIQNDKKFSAGEVRAHFMSDGRHRTRMPSTVVSSSPPIAVGQQACRTWFWIRSLIRSMGAAAVFETAAETPPTVTTS